LEIGIALDGIREELEDLFMREFLFLLKKSPFIEQSESGAYIQSDLSEAYLRDNTNIFIHEGEETIIAIETAIRSTVAKQLEQEAAFVTTAHVQRRDFLITFLPVFDIERHHVAFFVSYKEDSTVREYLIERAFLMAGTSVVSIALFVTVYLLRRSNIRIAQDERRFKLITESMHEGVCVLDQENRVTFVNRAGLWMLDYDREELQGAHLSDVTRYQTETGSVLQGRECPVYQAIAKGQRYTSDRYVLLTKSRQSVPVEITSAPIFQKREQVGSVVVLRDITLRKQAEAQLQQMNQQLQEASQHKSEFLSRMSHELRTPLNAMIGFTRITIEALKDDGKPKLVQNLIRAERSSRNLLELINDVLDFSKIEAGHMEIFIEDVDLADVLEEVLFTAEGLLLDNAVQLNTEIAPAFPVLRTDYTKLMQILNNLIGNAVKFTEHGSVTVRVFLRPETSDIRIEVEDTGCGIPEDKIATIFESFKQVDSSTTRRFRGTGLGLAITKKFCEMLHIAIGVESTPGEGSLFWLHVPVSCPPSGDSESDAPLEHSEFGQSAQDVRDGDTQGAGNVGYHDDNLFPVEVGIFPDENVTYESLYPDYATLIQQRSCLLRG
jgi:PAS domain S-box-containing protein